MDGHDDGNSFGTRLRQRVGLLADRDFRLLWLSSSATSFGSQVTLLALPLTAVTMLDATPAQMGVLAGLEALPFSLFSLHAGVMIDRMKKLPIIVACEAAICLTLAAVPIAAWLGALTMTLMYVVGFLLGVVFVIVGSASQVYLTQVAGRERLVEANSLFLASESTARLTGPGIAGLLIQRLTAPVAIVADCLTFIGSLALLVRIRRDEVVPARGPEASVHREIREGLALVLGHPILRPLTWMSTTWFIVFQGWVALQTLYATRELGLSPGELGVAHIVGGVGALASTLLARHANRRFGTGPTILAGVTCSALSYLLLAVLPASTDGPWTLAAALFVFDFGVTLYWIAYASLRQAITPDAMLGRMTATMRFFTVAAAPVGAVVAGHVAEAVGLRETFAGMSVIVLAMAALAYCGTGLRRIPDIATLDAEVQERGKHAPASKPATAA